MMADDLRGKVFSALTGRRNADVSGSSRGDLRGQLVAAFGSSKRDASKPDTAAAAKGLGVSQRTVQRWLAPSSKQHQKPKAETLKKLTTRARQAATTKTGRARALAQTLTAKGVPPAMRFTVAGNQGTEPQYHRPRTVNFDLDDPQHAQAFIDAYVDGGEQGALDYLAKNADEIYGVPGWSFGDVTNVDLSGPYGRN